MNAKTYLQKVKLCDTHINNKLEELERLKATVTKITATWKSDVVSGGSGSQDSLGDAVARIVDLQRELNRDIDNYVDLKKEIRGIVEQIDDADQLDILYKKYFLYETFEQISVEMNMTYRNVCYIHGKALQAVDRLLGICLDT